MAVVGLRQLLLFALAAAMVVVGVAGVTGTLGTSPVLAAALLVAAIVLAFDAGRRSVDLW